MRNNWGEGTLEKGRHGSSRCHVELAIKETKLCNNLQGSGRDGEVNSAQKFTLFIFHIVTPYENKLNKSWGFM